MSLELCPWEFLSEDRLRAFLTDPLNYQNAPDRKIVIDYLSKNFVKPSFLDVGCGTGHHYLALKQSGMEFDYCGVDKTEKMVEFARRRFPEGRWAQVLDGILGNGKKLHGPLWIKKGNPAFIHGDIHDLPFDDREWPIVYCRHVLVHLPGYKEALAELARVCSDCLTICLLKPLADKQQIKVEGKPPDQTKPGEFSEHYLNTYAREPFMGAIKNLGFDVVMDEMVEVGGYFGRYELIIARRGRA